MTRRRDIFTYLTSKMLRLWGTYQNNSYGNAGCLTDWNKSHPYHPTIYWFVKRTKLGQYLERRWVRIVHKRCAVKGKM